MLRRRVVLILQITNFDSLNHQGTYGYAWFPTCSSLFFFPYGFVWWSYGSCSQYFIIFPINLATVWESVTWTQLRESGKIQPPIPRIPLYPLFWLTWLVWIWIVTQHQCAGFQMFPSFRFYELGSRDFEGFDVGVFSSFFHEFEMFEGLGFAGYCT